MFEEPVFSSSIINKYHDYEREPKKTNKIMRTHIQYFVSVIDTYVHLIFYPIKTFVNLTFSKQAYKQNSQVCCQGISG